MTTHGSPRGRAPAQWTPSAADYRNARLTDFARFVGKRLGREVTDYAELHRWSVDKLEDFWTLVWDYFAIVGVRGPSVLAGASMPGARWFPGSMTNYVDQVLRHTDLDGTAVIDLDENADRRVLSRVDLARQIGTLAAALHDLGVRRGDVVAGYLPNIPEAVVAFLATASIGAIWSACGQDYRPAAATSRLGQLNPKILITADGYLFGGRIRDMRSDVVALRSNLPSLKATVLVERIAEKPTATGMLAWADVVSGTAHLDPVSLPFDHPLWVVFSSGTTGKPKGMVHGHGGVLLEQLKGIALQMDIGSRDTLFWYTSPSWIMWNFVAGALLTGATIVTYPGSPSHPSADQLWRLAALSQATVFGTSPGYLQQCIAHNQLPAAAHDLRALRAVGVTGSTLQPSTSLWLQETVGPHCPVMSMSGGTDIASAFMGAVRTVPVRPGELSVPNLAVALDSYDAHGNPVRDSVGELVVTKPMPSMPLRFWDDPDGRRYREAYFDMFPGVWRHGDWITIADGGGITIHGRSDSTLNRNGIRIGSTDIYQEVERLPEVAEALVVGVESPVDGSYWMPMFITLAGGSELDAALTTKISDAIRAGASPRHVPDEVIAAPGIPHTKTGKKLEVPIKRILMGAEVDTVVDRNAVDAPELLDWYATQRGNRLNGS